MKQDKPIAKLISIAVVFLIACFGWIFFRANSVQDAFSVISKIFTDRGQLYEAVLVFYYGGISLFILIFKDIKDEFCKSFKIIHSRYSVLRYIYFVMLLVYIMLFGALNGGQFIYFQF